MLDKLFNIYLLKDDVTYISQLKLINQNNYSETKSNKYNHRIQQEIPEQQYVDSPEPVPNKIPIIRKIKDENHTDETDSDINKDLNRLISINKSIAKDFSMSVEDEQEDEHRNDSNRNIRSGPIPINMSMKNLHVPNENNNDDVDDNESSESVTKQNKKLTTVPKYRERTSEEFKPNNDYGKTEYHTNNSYVPIVPNRKKIKKMIKAELAENSPYNFNITGNDDELSEYPRVQLINTYIERRIKRKNTLKPDEKIEKEKPNKEHNDKAKKEHNDKPKKENDNSKKEHNDKPKKRT